MNEIDPAKCTELDYINFLIASSRVFSCTEASKCSFIDSTSPSHDSFTRLLQRQPPCPEALWEEVNDFVIPDTEFLIIDDTVLDKPYSKHIDPVYRQWSGKHNQIIFKRSFSLWTLASFIRINHIHLNKTRDKEKLNSDLIYRKKWKLSGKF